MGVIGQALKINKARKEWKKGQRNRRQAQQMPINIPAPPPQVSVKKNNTIIIASIIGLTIISSYILYKKT